MYADIIITAMYAAQAQREAEQRSERRFQERIAGLPPEQQALAIKIQAEVKEKLRREAEVERRHRELCEAIRDSRPRGLGIFF